MRERTRQGLEQVELDPVTSDTHHQSLGQQCISTNHDTPLSSTLTFTLQAPVLFTPGYPQDPMPQHMFTPSLTFCSSFLVDTGSIIQ
jgi:hypothetical protein